jgi:hypothetical protein
MPSLRLAAVICASVLASVTALGDTVGYWRFEGAAGVSADKQPVPSEVNPKEAAGVGAKSAGCTDELKYSSELPGPYIYDPVTKTSRVNKSSMRFTWTAGAEGKGGTATYVEVADNPKLRPGDFTLEGFMKHDKGVQQYASIIAKRSKTNENTLAWSLDTCDWHPGGLKKLRMKFRGRGGDLIQTRSADSPTVTQEGWHHFAYTYDGSSGEGKLYWDGNLAHSFTIDASDKRSIDYADAYPLYIGGSPNGAGWPGWLDEIRLSNRALKPEQFLQASDKVQGTLEKDPSAKTPEKPAPPKPASRPATSAPTSKPAGEAA